ncbi:amidohydrolase family protein [Eubacteriaceae bacterium ES3]|nr:amidohydrolase family protein [Eubacteriaceae bacterium ES3]
MLYDAHIHCGLGQPFSVKNLDGEELKKGFRQMLENYLDMGIDRIRDGGDKWEAGLILKEIADEYPVTFLTPIFAIYKDGCYGEFLGQAVKNGDEACKRIRELKEKKADFIKIVLTGIMSFDVFGQTDPVQFSQTELKKMIDYTHELGLKAMVHVNTPEAIKMAIKAGADTIEHGYCIDDSCLELLAQSETIWVPTLAPFANIANCPKDHPMAVYREVSMMYFEGHKKAVRKGIELGVKIALGSDSGATLVPHGKGTLDELRFCHECGLSNVQLEESGAELFN